MVTRPGHVAHCATKWGCNNLRNQKYPVFYVSLICFLAVTIHGCEIQLPKTEEDKESKWSKDVELGQACST